MIETKRQWIIRTTDEWKILAVLTLANCYVVFWKTAFYRCIEFNFPSFDVSIDVSAFLPRKLLGIAETLGITKLIINNFKYDQNVVPLINLEVNVLAVCHESLYFKQACSSSINFQSVNSWAKSASNKSQYLRLGECERIAQLGKRVYQRNDMMIVRRRKLFVFCNFRSSVSRPQNRFSRFWKHF